MHSVWHETTTQPRFEALRKDVKTDVLIIGGGIAGLLCAYMLQQAGVDYLLVEKDKICNGITKNTTAKITSQHGLTYYRLFNRFGAEKTRMYLEANEAALSRYRELCRNIDCDFEEKDSFVYSLDKPKKIERELTALEKLGFRVEYADNLPLPFPIAGAVRFPRQAQFHPLKFLYAIAKNLRIYEHTEVKELAPNTAITDKAKITAKKIIVTTHFPFLNKHGFYFLKLFQQRSYVLAIKNAENVNGMYIDGSDEGLSLRNYKDLLLLGGGGHRTGEKGGNWQVLRKAAAQYYPHAETAYEWATQDCMTLDGVPYIGQYSKRTPDLYVATGFNKWGMTSAMLSAELLTDMVLGKHNPYAEVFSPSRTILRPQLAVNGTKAVLHLLTPTVPRCPHMGCALKYNPQERSWDCPCHGSRFTEEKKLIDNPATKDMK